MCEVNIKKSTKKEGNSAIIMGEMRRDLEFQILGEGFEEVHIVHKASLYKISKEFISLI